MTDLERLADAVEGLVHADTQVGDGRVDLTVDSMYDHVGPGRVDFGGDELESPEVSRLEPRLRDPDDDYGWWHLEPGGYPLELNERFVGDAAAWLATRDAVRGRGAFHPTLLVESLSRVPLVVGNGGLLVKENARVSTLHTGPD